MNETTTGEAPIVDWQALGRIHGARFDAQGALADFGDADGELHTALGDGGVVPLPALGGIRVVGADAASFLQAQLSQSVEDQEPGEWRLAGLCNPKGRLLGLFHVLRFDDEDFLLLTSTELIAGLVKRLRMFVLRARVAVQDFSPHMGICGTTGSGALALTEATGTLPRGTGTVVHSGDTSVLHLGGEPERFLAVAHARDVDGLWASLTDASRPLTPAAWRLLAIRAGEPSLTEATLEQYVPQQMNLDLIGGVSFNKGCFPGQEVIARLHYRGKPSRRMFRLGAPTGPVPSPGDPVVTADGTNAGEVVDAVAGPAGIEALAVLRLKHRNQQDLRLGEQPAGFAELPYTIPDADEAEAN